MVSYSSFMCSVQSCSVLIFLSASGRGFQVDYPSITLHAISRTESGPSVYCQLDEPVADDQQEDEDSSSMRELVIVPKDVSARALAVSASRP